ncbi:hypothetical protein D3C85_300820 [compost metagenome]
MLGLADQLTQVLPVCCRIVANKGFQGVVGAVDKTITPAFQAMKALVVLTGRSIELVEQGKNRFDVLVAHQPADKLHMAFFRRIGCMFGRLFEGAAQFVGQRQFIEQVGLQGGQALTQVLQGMQLAFDLGFTLLAGEVIKIFRHGGGPMENAAMIAASFQLQAFGPSSSTRR